MKWTLYRGVWWDQRTAALDQDTTSDFMRVKCNLNPTQFAGLTLNNGSSSGKSCSAVRVAVLRQNKKIKNKPHQAWLDLDWAMVSKST